MADHDRARVQPVARQLHFLLRHARQAIRRRQKAKRLHHTRFQIRIAGRLAQFLVQDFLHARVAPDRAQKEQQAVAERVNPRRDEIHDGRSLLPFVDLGVQDRLEDRAFSGGFVGGLDEF